jgi:hypothetical protein
VKPVYDLDEKTLYVVTAFQRDRLPFLQALGVVLARFQPRSPGHADA